MAHRAIFSSSFPLVFFIRGVTISVSACIFKCLLYCHSALLRKILRRLDLASFQIAGTTVDQGMGYAESVYFVTQPNCANYIMLLCLYGIGTT